jgi:hypothetical protein
MEETMIKTLENFMERLKKIDPAKVVGPKNEIKPWEDVLGEVGDNVKIIFGLMKEFGQEIIELKESCSEEKLRDIFSPESGEYISRSVEYKIATDIMQEEIRREFPEISNCEFTLRKGWKLVKVNPEKMMKYQIRSTIKDNIECTIFSFMECVIDIELIDQKEFSNLIEAHLDEIISPQEDQEDCFDGLRKEVIELFTKKIQESEMKNDQKKECIKDFSEFMNSFSVSFISHVIELI